MGDVTTDTLNALALAVENTVADNRAAVLTITTATTAAAAAALTLKRKTSGNMAAGFGPGIDFRIEDDTSGDLVAAQIFGTRDSADNTGALKIFLNSAGSITERLRIQNAAITALAPINSFYGGLTAGNAGGNRGAIQCLYGSGGNTAGYLVTYSRDGTPWYWWAEDDGTAKISAAAPVNNSDGTVIGLQF